MEMPASINWDNNNIDNDDLESKIDDEDLPFD